MATTTPDRVFPSTACLLQSRLDVHGCPAFDVQAVCTGFVYALAVADKFVATGAARTALVVGAETFSRIIDWTDRNTCVLFGDGAGAVVLRADDAPGIRSTHLHADGDYAELLHVPHGVSNNLKGVLAGEAYVQMAGREVFRTAVQKLGETVDHALEANGITSEDIDWLVPHQANIRIIAATAKKLGLPMERVVQTVAEHGNTSAASIPLALDHAVRRGDIRRRPHAAARGLRRRVHVGRGARRLDRMSAAPRTTTTDPSDAVRALDRRRSSARARAACAARSRRCPSSTASTRPRPARRR